MTVQTSGASPVAKHGAGLLLIGAGALLLTATPEVALTVAVTSMVLGTVSRLAPSAPAANNTNARTAVFGRAILQLALQAENAEAGIVRIVSDLARKSADLRRLNEDHARVAEIGRHSALAIDRLERRIAALEKTAQTVPA